MMLPEMRHTPANQSTPLWMFTRSLRSFGSLVLSRSYQVVCARWWDYDAAGHARHDGVEPRVDAREPLRELVALEADGRERVHAAGLAHVAVGQRVLEPDADDDAVLRGVIPADEDFLVVGNLRHRDTARATLSRSPYSFIRSRCR